MPDQRAIIAFDDGVQTLAIETSIAGVEGEAAWIVPLPSAPEIEAATAGLFPTTQRVFADPVRHPEPHLIDPILWIVTIVLMVAVLGQCASRAGRVCFTLGIVLGALLFLIPVLLPALSTARSTIGGGVRVVSRELVGGLDVATLEAESPGDLLGWLDTNGFAYDRAIEPVVGAYLDEGWVFVAAKMASSPRDGDAVTPMPLVFWFPVAEPVYPMRLTGVQNGPLQVELFVFGDHRASAPGLEVRACAETVRPTFNDAGRAEGVSVLYGYRGPELVIVHPGLREIVGDLPVGTRLVGTLSPEQMSRDVPVTWEAFRQTRRMPFTSEAVEQLAWRWGFGACAGTLLVAYAVRRRTDRARWFVVGPVVIAVAAVGAAAPWLAVPRVHGEGRGVPIIAARSMHDRVAHTVAETLSSPKQADELGLGREENETRLSWARRIAEASASEAWGERDVPAFPMQDVPLGYTLREGQAGLEYVWYGAYGQEIVVPLD